MSFSFESTGKAKVSFGNPTGHEFAKAQIPVAALGTEPFGTWIQRVSLFLLSRWTHVSSATLTSVSRLPGCLHLHVPDSSSGHCAESKDNKNMRGGEGL